MIFRKSMQTTIVTLTMPANKPRYPRLPPAFHAILLISLLFFILFLLFFLLLLAFCFFADLNTFPFNIFVQLNIGGLVHVRLLLYFWRSIFLSVFFEANRAESIKGGTSPKHLTMPTHSFYLPIFRHSLLNYYIVHYNSKS